MSSILAYVITSACVDVKDGACVKVCPVDCIYTHPDEPMYYINPNECIDCGSCEMVCPVQAIYRKPDVPEAETEFIARNEDYFTRRPDFRDFHQTSWS